MKRHAYTSRMLGYFDGIIARKLPSHKYPIYCRRISNHWVTDRYEHQIRKTLIEVCKKINCQTFYDIGSNVGIYSLDFLTHFGSSTAVAFEPNPKVFECLQMTKKANPLAALEICDFAVSNHNGTAILTYDPLSPGLGGLHPIKEGKYNHEINYGGISHTIQVQTSTLDSFIAHTHLVPNAIKIDAEGEELRILEGAEQLIEKHHPVFLLECSKDAEAIALRLYNHGYSLYDTDLNKTATATGMCFAIPRAISN